MAAMALRGARDSLATIAILKKNKRLMIQQRSGRSLIRRVSVTQTLLLALTLTLALALHFQP